jgi:ribonuclease HI
MTANQLSFLPQSSTATASISLYFDGAARNNPGPAGAGIIIKKNTTTIEYCYFYLGEKTNNQAEYLALILGLITAKKHLNTQEPLMIYSDSELLIQQMKGQYHVKNPVLQHLFNVVYLISKDMRISFNHISRIHNKEADKLANQAIDTKNPISHEYKRVLHEYNIKC